MAFTRYLRIYLLVLLAMLLSTAAANSVVDPDDLARIVELPGWNAEKTRLPRRGSRREKARALRLGSYRGIILGSSTAEAGLNPATPGFPQPGYNAALRGANMLEIAKVADYVRLHQKPEVVVIGLDFFAFSSRRRVMGDFEHSDFSSYVGRWLSPGYLLSLDTLRRSALTVLDNRRGIVDAGLGTGWNDLTHAADKLLHRTAFERILAEVFLVRPGLYADFEYGEDRIAMLEAVLRGFVSDGARVRVFISPIHARQLEAIRAVGLYPDWKRWRRDLATVVERVNGARQGPPVQLWDFAGHSSIHLETVPDQKLPMRFWWESSHYKAVVGEAIMAQILGARGSGSLPHFGKRLDPRNVEKREAELERGHARFVHRFPAEAEDVQRLVREILPGRRRD